LIEASDTDAPNWIADFLHKFFVPC
jgi:hypothetical protein